MSNKLIDYLLPRKKRSGVPRHISAKYNRGDITRHEAFILSAGLARDPAEARQVIAKLNEQYGANQWDYIQLQLFKPRYESFGTRLLKLMQRIFGESKSPRYTKRKTESRILVDYEFRK